MYGNIKTPIATSGTLPATGATGNPWLIAASVLAILVGVFACLMATGALWRIVPAGWRRNR